MMFCEAVYLPECQDEFLNISQVLNVQKSLHHYFFHAILYLQLLFIMSIYQCQQNNRKTVFVIEKHGTAIWRVLNLHVFC